MCQNLHPQCQTCGLSSQRLGVFVRQMSFRKILVVQQSQSMTLFWFPKTMAQSGFSLISDLNAVSKFDIFPTTCIDDLFEHLGKSKYLTPIDLCKDYWQVHFKQLCHELAAFRTPRGLDNMEHLPLLRGLWIQSCWVFLILPWPIQMSLLYTVTPGRDTYSTFELSLSVSTLWDCQRCQVYLCQSWLLPWKGGH